MTSLSLRSEHARTRRFYREPLTPPPSRLALALPPLESSDKCGGVHLQRVEKSTFVEDQVVTLADGTEITIHLFARAGAIGVGTQSGTGELKFTELPRIQTHRNLDKSGLYRWYNTYQLPAHLGDGSVTVRLHGRPEDDERRFNRTENVRQIPPSDPDFPALYRRRNDAESINRALDDTLWLRRAHSVGQLRQHVNMITRALVVNSVAVSRHRRMTGAGPPTAAVAA